MSVAALCECVQIQCVCVCDRCGGGWISMIKYPPSHMLSARVSEHTLPTASGQLIQQGQPYFQDPKSWGLGPLVTHLSVVLPPPE